MAIIIITTIIVTTITLAIAWARHSVPAWPTKISDLAELDGAWHMKINGRPAIAIPQETLLDYHGGVYGPAWHARWKDNGELVPAYVEGRVEGLDAAIDAAKERATAQGFAAKWASHEAHK